MHSVQDVGGVRLVVALNRRPLGIRRRCRGVEVASACGVGMDEVDGEMEHRLPPSALHIARTHLHGVGTEDDALPRRVNCFQHSTSPHSIARRGTAHAWRT